MQAYKLMQYLLLGVHDYKIIFLFYIGAV